jgi:hypothetical protein
MDMSVGVSYFERKFVGHQTLRMPFKDNFRKQSSLRIHQLIESYSQ